MPIAYHDWIKVDDLALKAIQLSLNEADRDVIVSRITSDYMTDVGAIGMLRQRWLETAFMQGAVKAQPLPAVVIEDVRRLHAARPSWARSDSNGCMTASGRGSSRCTAAPPSARRVCWSPARRGTGRRSKWQTASSSCAA